MTFNRFAGLGTLHALRTLVFRSRTAWLRRFQGRERDVRDESASVCLGGAGRQCIEAVLPLATDEVRVDVRGAVPTERVVQKVVGTPGGRSATARGEKDDWLLATTVSQIFSQFLGSDLTGCCGSHSSAGTSGTVSHVSQLTVPA